MGKVVNELTSLTTDKDKDPKNFEHCHSPCKFYCDKHFFECFIHCKICTNVAKKNYITDNDDTEEIEELEGVMELEEEQNDIGLYNQTYFYSVCDEITCNEEEEEFEESCSSRKKAKKNTQSGHHCDFLDQEAVEGD